RFEGLVRVVEALRHNAIGTVPGAIKGSDFSEMPVRPQSLDESIVSRVSGCGDHLREPSSQIFIQLCDLERSSLRGGRGDISYGKTLFLPLRKPPSRMKRSLSGTP